MRFASGSITKRISFISKRLFFYIFVAKHACGRRVPLVMHTHCSLLSPLAVAQLPVPVRPICIPPPANRESVPVLTGYAIMPPVNAAGLVDNRISVLTFSLFGSKKSRFCLAVCITGINGIILYTQDRYCNFSLSTRPTSNMYKLSLLVFYVSINKHHKIDFSKDHTMTNSRYAT